MAFFLSILCLGMVTSAWQERSLRIQGDHVFFHSHGKTKHGISASFHPRELSFKIHTHQHCEYFTEPNPINNSGFCLFLGCVQGLVKGAKLCLNPYFLTGWRSELAGCRSTLSILKIKVRISETKFRSFYKTLVAMQWKAFLRITKISFNFNLITLLQRNKILKNM